ncbi:MAG: SemiSWEET transporter [Alphaproteobacteria bacterium]|nr:SemiSWEET transporter [Alphaproteobacteria bacterium]
MTPVVILGSLAAIASTVSFAPQAIKIIRTRETKDISLGMYAITVIGFALWCAYGVLLRQWPLIASNSICLLLSGFILVMKLLSPRAKKTVADAVTPKT